MILLQKNPIYRQSFDTVQYNNVTNSTSLQHFEEINETMKNYSRDFQGFF